MLQRLSTQARALTLLKMKKSGNTPATYRHTVLMTNSYPSPWTNKVPWVKLHSTSLTGSFLPRNVRSHPKPTGYASLLPKLQDAYTRCSTHPWWLASLHNAGSPAMILKGGYLGVPHPTQTTSLIRWLTWPLPRSRVRKLPLLSPLPDPAILPPPPLLPLHPSDLLRICRGLP